MITQSSVREYVNLKSQITQQVFNDLINNPSLSTQGFLKSSLSVIKEHLELEQVQILPTRNWFSVLAQEEEIETLMWIIESANKKICSSWGHKIKKALFGRLLEKGLELLTDLDISNLSKNDQDKVGDALFLAIIYVNLS